MLECRCQGAEVGSRAKFCSPVRCVLKIAPFEQAPFQELAAGTKECATETNNGEDGHQKMASYADGCWVLDIARQLCLQSSKMISKAGCKPMSEIWRLGR